MVIDGEELCFNNGNAGYDDPSGYMVRVRHAGLAKAFKCHFDYLWSNSYQIKDFRFRGINTDAKNRLDEKCRNNGLVPIPSNQSTNNIT
jgi:hypothetical protein